MNEPATLFYSCAGVEACREVARKVRARKTFPVHYWSSFEPGGKESRSGKQVHTGYFMSGKCVRGKITRLKLTRAGNKIEIEGRTTLVSEYSPKAKGMCTTDEAEAAAKDRACSQLEIMKATRVADL